MAKIALINNQQTKNGGARGTVGDIAEIERVAYQLFVERGYEHGHDAEDWFRAETIVRNRKKS